MLPDEITPEEENNEENINPEAEEITPTEELSTPVPQVVSEPVSAYAPAWDQNRIDLQPVNELIEKVMAEIRKVVVGQEDVLELMMASLLTGGHVLLEGVPGIAKTLVAKLMAKSLSVEFNRIQFTPDLMPTDVIGTTIYNMQSSDFSFNRGPIFSNVVLIDEINRSPAKTQAALFEVMEERQVTVDGTTYHLDFPFFVVATQNPIEQEGTYKLPEAQLDRFLFKINLEYPNLEDEKQILRRFRNDFDMAKMEEVNAVATAAEIKKCRDLIEQVHCKDELLDYIAAMVHGTRSNSDLFLGASPRASLAIMRAAKAIAAMDGRDYVTPDDIQTVAYPVLNHRIILTPEREMEGYETKEVIESIVKKIEVPR